ncbi:MAG: 2-hydroxychromene-2-carboxylate isomerase [Alphaproteobacteria bacterium]|nr:2-hydroxychromene-2-carboxylate isomerase [Alphaproteobacteria bacterium]
MTESKPRTIDYYLTVNSPWAYLGSARLRAMAEQAGASVIVHTADFHRVFEATGGLPLPKRSPQRQAYRLVELERWSKETGEKIVMKPTHAVSPTLANLCVIAVRESGGDALAAAHALGRAYWVEDRDIADEAELADILDGLGLAGSTVVNRVEDDLSMAEIYDSETQQAIDRGVFGAPWYVYAGEPFWGQDRLSFLEKKLKEE